MRSILSLFTTLVALAGVASAGHGSGFQAKRHGSRSLPSRQEDAVSTLDKRQQFSGGFTFFDDGLGACGITNFEPQKIAAVPHALFDSVPGYDGTNPNNNPICGKWINAHYKGKTVTVQVTDRCGGCEKLGSLDFSHAAFDALSDETPGRIPITWEWA